MVETAEQANIVVCDNGILPPPMPSAAADSAVKCNAGWLTACIASVHRHDPALFPYLPATADYRLVVLSLVAGAWPDWQGLTARLERLAGRVRGRYLDKFKFLPLKKNLASATSQSIYNFSGRFTDLEFADERLMVPPASLTLRTGFLSSCLSFLVPFVPLRLSS